jgi:LysR family transcriptional regulator, hydrogen peroxide-inducible genes activator
MELHQFRYAVAVATMGSFSRAAEQCNVSQPSLSQQIQKLEGELGVQLFERRDRNILPTTEGRRFLREVLPILKSVENVKYAITTETEFVRKTLNIGVIPSIAPYFFAKALRRFCELQNSFETLVHEGLAGDLLRKLELRELDLAILSLPANCEEIEIRVLFTEELFLAVGAKSPLATKEKIMPTDLQKERLILMREGCSLSELALDFCQKNHVHPKTVRNAQLETVQSLVIAGLGLAFVPQMARLCEPESIVYRSFEDPKPTRTVAAVWLKGKEQVSAVREFLANLTQAVTDLSSNGGQKIARRN